MNSPLEPYREAGLRPRARNGRPYRALYAMPVVWVRGSEFGQPIPDEHAPAGRADSSAGK